MYCPDDPSSSLASDYDLLNYLEIIAKNSRMIIKVTVTVALLSIAVALLLPKIYSSTALILPPQQDTDLLGLMLGGQSGSMAASLAGGLLGTGTPADQYASILECDHISDIIIDRFNLMKEYNIDYRTEMYKKLDKLVDIRAGKKDGIISITVEDEDPNRAAAIANAYVEEVGKLSAELSMNSGSKNKLFLEKRLAQAHTDLATAEEKLKVFQSQNKAIDLTEQAKASIVGIADLRAQLALQEVQLAAIRRRFTDNSQEVKDASAAINKIKSQIAQFEGINKGGALPTVGSVPGLEQQYIRLTREFKIQETLVELLTKQYELAKLTEAKDTNNIQVIQRARPADKKVKPKRALIVLGSTFFSVFCSIMYALFIDYKKNLPEQQLNRWKNVKAAFMMNKRQ